MMCVFVSMCLFQYAILSIVMSEYLVVYAWFIFVASNWSQEYASAVSIVSFLVI